LKAFLDTVGRKRLTSDEIKMMNGSKLAYIGDAVYELYIRTYVMHEYKTHVNALNKKSITLVKAAAQARAVEHLKPQLTEQEWSIVLRGRNMKTSTPAKNASLKDYKLATGWEALIGALYLRDEKERLESLIAMAIDFLDPEVSVGQ